MKLWLVLLIGTAALFLLVCPAVFGAEENEVKENDDESVGTVIGIDLGTTYSWYVQYAARFTLPIMPATKSD